MYILPFDTSLNLSLIVGNHSFKYKKLKLEELYSYPIKSTKGIQLNEVVVDKLGFENDRYFGIANAFNELVTARENPRLLKLKTEINNDNLRIIYKQDSKIVSINTVLYDIQVSLFKKEVQAKLFNTEINKWLTKILKAESKLIKINSKNLRQTNDTEISFSDLYPIHLISKESVVALNKKLESPVETSRFRPNIIVSGFDAFEEEKWTAITIGNCEFKVVSKTERCTLITIDPKNGEKNTKQEPLRTLAKEFKTNKKVNFGIYLIPTKIGKIQKSDTLKVKTMLS